MPTPILNDIANVRTKMDSANNKLMRILCHGVEVDGELLKKPDMQLITIDTAASTACISDFQGIETPATIFVNGIVHILHLPNGRLKCISDADGNILYK